MVIIINLDAWSISYEYITIFFINCELHKEIYIEQPEYFVETKLILIYTNICDTISSKKDPNY